MITFDPKKLIAPAKIEYPELVWLHEALAHLKAPVKESNLMIHYVDPSNANQPGAKWQFKENIELEDTLYGSIIIDILKGNQIGGIEFFSRICGFD